MVRRQRWLYGIWLCSAACSGDPRLAPSDLDASALDATAAAVDAMPATPADPPTDCCGCLCADPSWSCSEDTCSANGLVHALAPEAGFFEIEPGVVGREGARMWYSFWPADDRPEQRPLAVFLQGGPFASMVFLWGSTGPKLLDPVAMEDQALADNPHSWTRFANLLYVDSPFAGFSYLVGVVDPQIGASARSEAAAFVRVLLRFLARHPKLERAPIVLAGESYGGMRATLMLRQLLRYGDLEQDPSWYRDPALAAEIREHLRRTRDAGSQTDFTPGEVAEQFGTQVLIQPAVMRDYLKFDIRSDTSQCEAEPSLASPLCDAYRADLEVAPRTSAMVKVVQQAPVLAALSGVDVESIRWFHASERTSASSRAGWVQRQEGREELSATFGELSFQDTYYTALTCPQPGCADDATEDLDQRFVDNVLHVATFMTDAARDSRIDTLKVLESLPHLQGVSAVTLEHPSPRAAEILVTFEAGLTRRIRVPRYEESGHMVSFYEPELLLQDVSSWLDERLAQQR